MADLLVKLYELPSLAESLQQVAPHGIVIRRAIAPEKPVVIDWVRAQFPSWTAEVETAFGHVPLGCFLAVRDMQMLGFACHDVVCRNFFGPTGVAPHERGHGIGRALLLAALHAQREAGYAYAVIAGVGPEAFYVRTVGALPIAGSTPGIYAGMLRK